MAKLFISHSSKDKPFVEQLTKKLEEAGHSIWLDKNAIKVGDSIPGKISEGLDACEFVVLVLSKSAVESKWVESEWTAKYWDQISEKKKFILPILLDDCKRPTFLKTLKYANFRDSFDVGFAELSEAFRPPIDSDSVHVKFQTSAHAGSVTALLARAASPDIPLSSLLVEALAFARKAKAISLDTFCREELEGKRESSVKIEDDAERRSWRVVECFASTVGKLNQDYIGFRTEHALFSFVESQPEKFVPMKFVWGKGVIEIEEDEASTVPNATAMIVCRKHRDMVKGSKTPDADVYIYFRPNCQKKILSAIRRELVAKLLSLLPPTFS